jgi:hypothetical protein
MSPNQSRKEHNHAGSGSEKEAIPHNRSLYTHVFVTMPIYNAVAQGAIPAASLPFDGVEGYHTGMKRKLRHILQTVCTVLKANRSLLKC